MPDITPRYFNFNDGDISDDDPIEGSDISDDSDNDVQDDFLQFENEDEPKEEQEDDPIVDPYYFCVRE